MCWYELNLEPRDMLFFRDAKPMEASSIGSGANWPMPNVLHDALKTALHETWPTRQDWEVEHKHRRSDEKRGDISSLRFGGLHTIGMFPCKKDPKDGSETLFLPCPADLGHDGKRDRLIDRVGDSNLPAFLDYMVATETATKERPPAWITAQQWLDYAEGRPVSFNHEEETLFDRETRPGIALDADTGTTVDGKFYIAEYMRLRADVYLKGLAKCASSLRGTVKKDVMAAFFENSKNKSLLLGGQRGMAHLEQIRKEHPLLNLRTVTADKQGCLIKWVLLTPAVFLNGWRPDWVDDQGSVQLPAQRPPRQPGLTRKEWRAGFNTPIQAKLVAAKVGKPMPFSGWNNHTGGPRTTHLAVPAGSVYWFRAASDTHGKALAEALHAHCKSNLYGEKGFGFGFCTNNSEGNKEIL
ncbi:MAG: hypothetical protein EOL87_02125 [Spartobacteria bacterium]|nr:hypothetical protein [Spartobacteria bacterium]